MQSLTGTNGSQPERPFQGVNVFSISMSRSSRSHQYSGFRNIDDVGVPANPRRNTFPQHQRRGILFPDRPQAISPAASISYNPRHRTTIITPADNDVHPTGGGEHAETQGNQGNRATHPDSAQHTEVAQPPPSVPEDFRKRDLVKTFATKTLPRLIYLHLLLRLPYLYFSRVDKIFWGAELSMAEIKEMALQDGSADVLALRHKVGRRFFSDTAEELPPAYLRLKARWEELIDTLMEEWKTLNIISVLLLGAIMTTFQIDGASQDPITRYLAFCSLICALMSLLHGCMFIVRFSTMRKGYRAAEWALEAQKYLNAFWNVWVMLSMPLLWLTWSTITFIICTMTFMWRSRARLPEGFTFSVPLHTEISAKIVISVVLGMGAVYTLLIIKTLRRYGTRMDEAWKERIDRYIEGLTQEDPLAIPSGQPAFSGPATERAQTLGVLTEGPWGDLGDTRAQSIQTTP